MGRVVNTNNPGKIRNQLRRTGAEILRQLSQKSAIDEESKDMISHLVFCLREIDDGIEASAEAWEKRDYWIKAEQLRQRWAWTGSAAARLERIVRQDDWELLPTVMVELFERFADVKVTKFTRKPDEWSGAYARLLDERA